MFNMKHSHSIFFKQIHLLDILIATFAVFALLTVCFIFHNSMQSKSQSNDKSNPIAESIQDVVDSESKIDEEYFHKYVRKVAHGIEFSVLGIALGGLMISIDKKCNRKYISLMLLIMLLVSVTDESIQEFNDRISSLGDVFIDFGGAIIGFLLVICTVTLVRHKKRKTKG